MIPIAPSEVHVWWLSLEGEPQAFEPDRVSLSSEELARAGRYHFDRDRRRFVGAHGLLRRILGDYAGEDPAKLALRTSASGKPFLASHPGLHFNLSHCEDWGVLAIAGQPLGVDLERVRDVPDALSIAESFFTAGENRALRELPAEERSEAFLRCWTRKEAYVKARGGGLATTSLASFEVPLDRGSPRPVGPRPAEGTWNLYDIDTRAGWIGALAVDSDSARLVHRSWPPVRPDGRPGPTPLNL